jgi:hypothetical protein
MTMSFWRELGGARTLQTASWIMADCPTSLGRRISTQPFWSIVSLRFALHSNAQDTLAAATL